MIKKKKSIKTLVIYETAATKIKGLEIKSLDLF